MACDILKCGILVTFIFLTCSPKNTETGCNNNLCWIQIRNNRVHGNTQINCKQNHINKLSNFHGYKNNKEFSISDAAAAELTSTCVCKRRCKVFWTGIERYKNWLLKLRYHCSGGRCSSVGSSTNPTTVDTVSSTLALTSKETTKTTLPERPSLSSGSSSSSFETTLAITNDTSDSTLSTNNTQTGIVTSGKQTTLELQTTTSSSNGASTYIHATNEFTPTTVEATTILSDTTTNFHNGTFFTSKKPQFDFYSKYETKDTTTIIAVCVTAIVLLLVGCALGFIWYRRLRRQRTEDVVYKNGSTVTKENDVVFTNRTYSKSLDEAHVKDDDTLSHCSDSGYTDMHTADTPDDTKNDYYLIKDGIEEILQNANDDYYAIKDNVTNEYNKIAFSPKLIPDDPSYGHTLFVANTKDKTYDHVDGKGFKVNASIEDTVLQDDDYSHLNQSKRHVNTNMRNIPLCKTIENDTVVSELNKEGAGNKSAHEYFILEQNESSTQDEVHKEYDDSHKYFVLDREIITNEKLKNVKDFSKVNENFNATPIVKGGGLSDDLIDRTYFETCQQVDVAADTHQYQALEAHVIESKSEAFGGENHDYFVLEKETDT